MNYVIEIDGARREESWFVDALHAAYQAVEQGAVRVVLSRAEDDRLTPLCVLTPPEEAS